MRVGTFVSVFFAASLLGGVAMADRPSADGMGRGARHVQPREMSRTHEAREAREARPQRDTVTRAKDPHVTDRLRARGDMNERYGARAAAQSKAARETTASIKSQRDADKALHRITDKGKNQMNCSPTDDTCKSSRVAKTTDKADKGTVQAQRDNKQAQEVQKMREKIRMEKLKAIIFKKLCEKNANTCSENL